MNDKESLEKEAKQYLSNAGYGSGTNYSTNTVAALMASFAYSQFKPNVVEAEKLREALEDAVNGLQWKIDNEDYDNSDVEKLEEWKLILQDNCLSKEKDALDGEFPYPVTLNAGNVVVSFLDGRYIINELRKKDAGETCSHELIWNHATGTHNCRKCGQ